MKQQKPKISFIAAMLIVIGSSIGAGIFFKSSTVLENSQASLVLAIFNWLVASVAVIAMALALIEIASVRNDNLSIISWVKVFNRRWLYHGCKNFMTYLYLPLTFFFMPLYFICSIQDGFRGLLGLETGAHFNTSVDWLIWLALALIITTYFLTIPPLYAKVGNIQNMVVSAVKFIPLVFVPIIGFIVAGTGNGELKNVKALVQPPQINGATASFTQLVQAGYGITRFTGIGAGMGSFISIAAIFFAYDGFYVTAGLQSEMREPKKTPWALFLGLLITTLFYLILAVALSINGGLFSGMEEAVGKLFNNKRAGQIVFGVVNLMIGIGVLGIINGFALWAPRFVEDLLAQGDLPFWKQVQGRLNPNKPVVGVIYCLVLSLTVQVLFTVIGALAYLPTVADYKNYVNTEIDKLNSMQWLYSFSDLMATWTSLFTFAFIACAIFGAIVNRKTKQITIANPKRYFLPAAWIAVVVNCISVFVTIIEPFINLFLLFGYDETVAHTVLGNDFIELNELVIGRVMLIVVLVFFAIISFLPVYVEDQYHKRKFGSLANYQQYVQQHLAHSTING